ncbi:MAG TPA: hypothetical protein VMO17_12565 [Terriglobia bacterium]|nr:hypothetical protein [Terriglobia bacterium]
MTMPRFTAEAALGPTSEGYAVGPGSSGSNGGVVPQGTWVDRGGNIWYCDNTVGCFIVGRVPTHLRF